MARAMQTWDPFRNLWDIRGDIDRLFFGPSTERKTNGETAFADWSPPVDICENANSWELSIDLPGLKQKDIKVSIEDNTLSVSGERKFEKEESKENFHRVERTYGSFARQFTLPATVNAAQVQATMKDGVLCITLPKREESKPKAIEVKVS